VKDQKYTTEDFWKVIKDDLDGATKSAIETYRALVLNPFSHYNTERHEICRELQNALQAMKDLKDKLKAKDEPGTPAGL